MYKTKTGVQLFVINGGLDSSNNKMAKIDAGYSKLIKDLFSVPLVENNQNKAKVPLKLVR